MDAFYSRALEEAYGVELLARGRAGVVFAERHLLYVTGGAAFAEYNGFKALDFPGFVGFRYAGAVGDTRVGWVVGVGWEYAFMSNWSAFIEYDHYFLGTKTLTFTTPAGAIFGTADIKATLAAATAAPRSAGRRSTRPARAPRSGPWRRPR